MSARVGRSGSEEKPDVEMKPREAELSLSLPTWAKAKANPVSIFCTQPRNVGFVGAPHRFPMTSACVSAYFQACSRLWRSRVASREGPVPFVGTCLPLRVAQVGAVNEKGDPEWIRAKRYFGQTVESLCLCGARLVRPVFERWAPHLFQDFKTVSSAHGQRVRDCLARAHGTGSYIVGDNPSAMVLWEPLTMSMSRHQ